MSMMIAACELSLRLRAVRSLKDKRRIVRQVLERTRARFPVSIAETGDNDVHHHALVGVALVTNDRRVGESTLDQLVHFIDQLGVAEILQVDREVVPWEASWDDGPLTMADLERSR